MGRFGDASGLRDGHSEMTRPAIVEVVAIDRGPTTWFEAELCQRLNPPGAARRGRASGLPVAKLQKAQALGRHRHDHDGGVPLRPALADIGTGRLFANGRQISPR